jgi:hypothetical protein
VEAEGTTLTTRSEPYHVKAIHAQAKINQTRMRTEYGLFSVTDTMKHLLRILLGRGLPANVACPLPVCRRGLDKDADTRLVCGVDIPPLKSSCLSDAEFSL